ncbi:hypothetical protein [Glycomyces harbinensis]|uniref:hypothetical protein n=1 Tax=Glycomyces harbinensis TaxID=58114 RepID=UPI00115FCD45|nr:hypothetical protein [Glycomyces harbinensis]
MGAYGLSHDESIWPYRFEIDLKPFRRRANLPRSTPNPYFDLWLFDDPDADHQLLERYSGLQPGQSANPRSSCYVAASSEEVRHWAKKLRAVLAELRWIATDTERDLEAGVGIVAVQLCRELMVVVAEDHWTVLMEINEALRDNPVRVRYPAPWTAEARRRREVHNHNAQYGGGYSSG